MRDMRGAFIRHTKDAKSQNAQAKAKFDAEREDLTRHHAQARTALQETHKARWLDETKERSNRLNSGLRGVWQWVTGQRARIQEQNKAEAQASLERDRKERNTLLERQMRERRDLQQRQQVTAQQHAQTLEQLREDRDKARAQQRQLLDQLRQANTHKSTGRNTGNQPQQRRPRDGPEHEL
jgi:hypothetical protein